LFLSFVGKKGLGEKGSARMEHPRE